MLTGTLAQTTAQTFYGQGFSEVVFRRRGIVARLFWLVLFALGWVFGLIFGTVLLAAAGTGQSWFLPVWLAGWGLGGLFWFWVLLMNALVVESLIARSDRLTLLRRLFVLRFPVDVPVGEFRDIRWIADNPFRIVRVNGRRIPQTGIEIVTTGRNLHCANGIGEAEASTAIAALRQRLVMPRRRD